MQTLCLTGSIATGKSTVASMLRQLKIPVYDSDIIVHNLLKSKIVRPLIMAAFPDAIIGSTLNKAILRNQVLSHREAMRQLEYILHPLVSRMEHYFLKYTTARRIKIVAIDIPLLFETRGEQRCNTVMIIDVPYLLQVQRALDRPALGTISTFKSILSYQIPEGIKKRQTSFVVPTGLNRHFTWRHLERIVRITCNE